MTIGDVRQRLHDEILSREKYDPEAMHAAEDVLFADVLRAIANGTAEDPRAMAALALMSLDEDFPRWCA